MKDLERLEAAVKKTKSLAAELDTIAAGQGVEAQCRDCTWWLERGEGSNACFPRAITYVLSPINETAMPAHQATFSDCLYRVKGGIV